MKKLLCVLLAVIIVLGVSSCGASAEESVKEASSAPAPTVSMEQETQEPEAPLTEVEERAIDGVKYLKDQLVMPESFEVKQISYVENDISELTYNIKIRFSAKNPMGGVIDEACAFEYQAATLEFTTIYQNNIELSKLNRKMGAIDDVQAIMNGEDVDNQSDSTSIYNDSADFLEASKTALKHFEIRSIYAEDLDVERIMKEVN